jgi:HipA-like protein
MAADVLDIFLGDRKVGAIIGLGGDRTVFTFDDAYADDPGRPTLSLSFKDAMGDLIRDQKRTQTRLSPFFSNLLPEGPLRDYLAERAGVNAAREFNLLRALGRDLPGAIVVRGPDGGEPGSGPEDDAPSTPGATSEPPLRFSLAGVQLKFSALEKAKGGLTVPATGVGGSWIVKLPSTRFPGVSENEFSMMTLARSVGIDVPDISSPARKNGLSWDGSSQKIRPCRRLVCGPSAPSAFSPMPRPRHDRRGTHSRPKCGFVQPEVWAFPPSRRRRCGRSGGSRRDGDAAPPSGAGPRRRRSGRSPLAPGRHSRFCRSIGVRLGVR